MTFRSLTLIRCYDMIHLIWAFAIIPLIWFVDMIHLILSFDMILFAIHSVMMIWLLSLWYEILFCYALGALLWLWIALLCLFWYVMLWCPSFYSSHGGTMAVSSRHRWHDTIWGGVISPQRSLLLWYEYMMIWLLRTYGHSVIYMHSLVLVYVFCFRERMDAS